jgi:hypothetical protein
MKPIKIGRVQRRVVFENTVQNWKWLEDHSDEPIDKPYWATTSAATNRPDSIDEDDAFLFLRQYYKHVNGFADNQAALDAIFLLWKCDAHKGFEQHLLHHGLISEGATTSIDGDLVCEHVAKTRYGKLPTCNVKTYFRQDGMLRCSTIIWGVLDGLAFDLNQRACRNLGMPYRDEYRLWDVEPEIMLNAIKWRKHLVWFEKDIRMLQVECLFSKQ